jgi:hypothetical protein
MNASGGSQLGNVGMQQLGNVGISYNNLPQPGISIYLISVDDESGRTMAISASDPGMRAISYTEDGALAALVKANPGITIARVIAIDSRYQD